MATIESPGKPEAAIRIGGVSIPWLAVVVMAVLVALFVALNYAGIGLLMERWNSDPSYGHGYLIPLISLYFLWTKKEELLKMSAQPCLPGLAIFLLGLPLRFVATPLNSAGFAGLGIVLMVNGLALYLWGWRIYRAAWLPAVYLIFMVPLPEGLYAALANPLQLFASWAAAGILDNVLGISTMRDGNIILLAHHTLQVAEACSGMRSIMGLSALGVAFAYFWERSVWERIFLIVSTVPIAIVANISRVTVTGVIYHMGHEQFAQGFYHEFTGWFVFIFAMALFLIEAWVMSHVFVYDRAHGKADTRGEAASPRGTGRTGGPGA